MVPVAVLVKVLVTMPVPIAVAVAVCVAVAVYVMVGGCSVKIEAALSARATPPSTLPGAWALIRAAKPSRPLA
jgi:hypothetical protein